MIRLAALTALTALTLCLTALPARAQLSGGLDGKWTHHTLHLLAPDGRAAPIADIWATGPTDAPLIAWHPRTTLASADLDRALIITPATTQTPTTQAIRATQTLTRTHTTPSETHRAHLFARDADGIADTLLHLHLTPGCHTACAIEAITLTHLPGATLTLTPRLTAPAPRLLTPVDRFPVEPGDRTLTLR